MVERRAASCSSIGGESFGEGAAIEDVDGMVLEFAYAENVEDALRSLLWHRERKYRQEEGEKAGLEEHLCLCNLWMGAHAQEAAQLTANLSLMVQNDRDKTL